MLEALSYDFIQRSLWAGLILAMTAPLIGSFLVARRYSLMADALAHVSLFGVGLGLLLGIHPLAAALVTALLTAWVIEGIRERQGGSADTLLAIFLWGGLAGAVVLVSLAHGFKVNLYNYLFGDIAGVQPEELWVITLLGSLVILVFWAFRKEFFALALDEELAKASGIRARVYNRVLILMAAITVALAARVMGVLLIGALMVIPFSAAANLNKSFFVTLLVSVGLSMSSVTLGIALSYRYDLAPGGTIVLCALGFFLLSLLFRSKA